MARKDKRKIEAVLDCVPGVLLLIGVFMFVDWLIDEYFFAILLLAAGVFPLLIFITGVGMVVSILCIIAGKK